MEPPDIVIADRRVIVAPSGEVVGIGASPPVLSVLDPPQVWIDGAELRHIRSVDIEMSFGPGLPGYIVTATSPYVDYTIRTTRLTLKPKEKS